MAVGLLLLFCFFLTTTGLVIHPPSASQNTTTPSYTLVRLSATHDNPAWHQTNLILPPQPEDVANNNLDWATEITQIIEHQLPRALAHRQGNGDETGRGDTGFDSDSDELDSELESDSDFDAGDDAKADFLGIRGVDTEDQVHLHRVRIWGLAASPGGGTSALFISLHSNLELERDTFAGLNCRVLFSTHPQTLTEGHGPGSGLKSLSTEARAWEWMYGGGPPVPGFSSPATSLGDDHMALRDQFVTIARRQLCVFCELPLLPWNISSRCDNGHIFGTFWPAFEDWIRHPWFLEADALGGVNRELC